ncbi:BRCT domain [Macleaya cordata]|uniref:BRCT domain n=1 Tax=Macleaya cordata TaxID=56857 RepID=A0A200PWK2_MACCD|nr:BRCT domain [Macleaya cordata]
MLQNGEDSPYGGSPSKTFDGVRFALLGFDPIEEAKVKSKLVNGGGVNVGEYGPICTHVIVDKIVYDDPCCVAARNDGKSVVNSLWVDHSFDVGIPVDASLILYRPVKDLNGIPGAKSFCICLTGYQRQDRDDIMRMVGLMGAYFSKPLVANKVTHLICYKFEGEKYELAKKMKKIKLVNHRWLEDCLKAWEILPECNYDKSGHEIEIMEAEAKDSEEETEEYRDTKQLRVGNAAESSSKLQSGSGTLISKGSDSNMPVGERSEIHQHASTVKGLLDTTEGIVPDNRISNTGKEIEFQKTPDLLDVNKKGQQEFGCLGSGAYYGDGTSGAYDKTPSSNTGKRAFHSDATNLSTLSYSRKMPKNSPTSIFSGEHSSHLRSSPQGHLDEHKFKDGFGISQLNLDQDKNNLDFGRIENQRNDSELHHSEVKGENKSDTPKRKLALSDTSFGSPKNRTLNSGICASGSTLASARPEGEMIVTPEMKSNPALSNSRHPVDAVLSSVENQSVKLSKTKPLNVNKKSMKCGLPVSRTTISDNPKSPSEVKVSDITTEWTPETALQEPKQPDLAATPDFGDVWASRSTDLDVKALSPKSRISEADKSRSSVNLGVHKGKKNGTSSRSGTKKMVAKRSLDSRPKLGTGSTTEWKGSLNLDQTLTSNEAAFCSEEGKNGAVKEKMSTVQPDMVGPTLKADAVIEKNANGLPCSVNMNGAMDDETEAPEEGNVGKSSSEEMTEPSSKADKGKEENSKGLHSASEIKRGSAHVDDETLVSGEDRADLKKTEVDWLASTADRVEEMMEGVYSSNRNNKNALSTMKEIETSGKDNDGGDLDNRVNDEKLELEKKKEVLHPASKLKRKTESVKKTEKPIGVEEKKAIETGGPNLHSGKYARKKVATKSNRDRMQTNKIVCGTDPDVVLATGGENPSSETGKNGVSVMKEVDISREGKDDEDIEINKDRMKMVDAKQMVHLASKTKKSKTASVKYTEKPTDEEESKSAKKAGPNAKTDKHGKENVAPKSNSTVVQINKIVPETDADRIQEAKVLNLVRSQPVWFILSGHRLQRKEFQQVIRRLKGRFCRDSHHWSYQATHFIVPDPVRRTEKFFAAAASGRWILKTDYLTASNQAGKFLEEEPYEWFKNGLSEDGAINLEAPRKWRLLRERTGHGAFYGMRIIIYGECIAPPLDTLKRVVKAGDGTILATSPPYTKFLKSGVDFAVISPGMPRVDSWVQEFLRNEIPCVMADYLVEYVCKPGYSLERHVLYNTRAWAEKSFGNLLSRSEEIVEPSTPSDDNSSADLPCHVCGSRDRGEVMLICGDESGSVGCGIGTHIDCCDPPLEAVPEEDWFCPKCCKTGNNNSSSSSSSSSNPSKTKKKKGSSKLKCKK